MSKKPARFFIWIFVLVSLFACTISSRDIRGTPVPTSTLYPTPTLPIATPSIAPTFTDTLVPIPTDTFTPEPTGPVYRPLLGLIWTGVKVYYGTLPEKTYGFEIMGGSDNCPSMPSGRGVKVKYPNGKEEWKDRMYLAASGLFFVLDDDPALSNLDWRILSDCP